jgi:heterodisulfide reductase subunit D
MGWIVGPHKPLEEYREEVWHCQRCNWCKIGFGWTVKSQKYHWSCPSFTKFRYDAYSAQGRMHIALALIEEMMDWKDSEKLREIIYACDTCGACAINCIRIMENNPLEVIEALRARAVELGIGPMPAHKRLAENVRETHNVYGEPHADRMRWISDDAKPSAKADTALFMGCTAPYQRPELMRATARVLKASGVDFTVLPDEWCCGSPLFRTGQLELAKEMVKHNVEVIKALGVKRLVFNCPVCYRCFAVDYPKIAGDLGFELIHVVELIADLYNKGRIKFKELPPEVVTYHDPCNLGRHLGVYDAPRTILNAIKGIKLVEMERIKDQAWCCGAGGGVRDAFPDLSLWTAKQRVEEAIDTGATKLVSSCPFCASNLEWAIKEMGVRMRYQDITQIVEKIIVRSEL